MRESIRLRILRQSKTPIKKHPRHRPQSKSQAEQEAKPLGQNDLVKWIVISDAPDHAAAESHWRSSKNFPVMARKPKYLEHFGARDLRTGLKCLRGMNDCAQRENEKLEREAEALGCVVLAEMDGSGPAENTPAASTAMDFDTPLAQRAEKSQIAVLRFDQCFYRAKVLPFIQACLIAEDGSFNPEGQPPSTPTALPFPGNIKHNFESPRQLHEAKGAYDTAANAGLPQEACDTAARRRLSLVRKRDAPAVKLPTVPEPESDSADLEFPPTPGGFYVDGDDLESQQSQTSDGFVAAARDRSPTPSECPPTPRAPDFGSSPGMGDALQADMMDVDESESAGTVAGSPASVDHDARAVSAHTDDRADTPMAKTTATTATPAATTTPSLALQPASTPAHATTITRTPASLPLPSTYPKAPLPPPFCTPQQPLRRSTRSTQSKTSNRADASQQQQPVARMSVRQLQREILRLCAERETTRARNAVLREWLAGVAAAAAAAVCSAAGAQEEVESMEVDG